MGLNKFGTAITVITAVTLAALAVEIFYVLWQRRQRLRPRVRVEPHQTSLPCSSSSSPGGSRERELELEIEQHASKWQCLYGPSRVLFTIKEEEEREGLESENSCCSSSEVVVKKSNATRSAWVSEKVEVDHDEVAVAVEGLLLLNNETTPFSTPCASPPYYTPYSSPCRDAFMDSNG